MIDDCTRNRVRSFIAVLQSYPVTMKQKHITVALRAFAAAFDIPATDIVKVSRELEKEIEHNTREAERREREALDYERTN